MSPLRMTNVSGVRHQHRSWNSSCDFPGGTLGYYRNFVPSSPKVFENHSSNWNDRERSTEDLFLLGGLAISRWISRNSLCLPCKRIRDCQALFWFSRIPLLVQLAYRMYQRRHFMLVEQILFFFLYLSKKMLQIAKIKFYLTRNKHIYFYILINR